MEKGTLLIQKTKKGYAAWISYTKKSGKQGKIPITVYRFQDDKLNGQPCTFLRDGGTLIKLVQDDGKVLYDATQKAVESKKGAKSNEYKVQDSYNISKTQLPKDTRALISGDIENFALKYNKAARFDSGKFYFFKKERKGDNYQIRADFSKIDFNSICERQTKQAKALFDENVVAVDVKPQWRWLSGLGEASVYETGLVLHHVYGCPFLPGSAIKGVLRSFLITEIWGTEKDSEAKAFNESKIMCDLFGCPKDLDGKPSFYKKIFEEDKKLYKSDLSKYRYGFQERKGLLTFFDFFPKSEPDIEVDIMNPHYMEYYGGEGKRAPTDFQLPVPVPFLTIGKKARFQTYVGSKFNPTISALADGEVNDMEEFLKYNSKEIPSLSKDSTILDIAKWWLTQALSNHGLGAKTAVGYGYFE
jgi:CRISPR-associated protein Cmr6